MLFVLNKSVLSSCLVGLAVFFSVDGQEVLIA